MKKIFLTLIKSILIILVLGMLAVWLIPIKSGVVTRIALLPIEKRLRKKIEFNASRIWLPANIFLEGVSIIDKGGRLYYFNAIDVHYDIGILILKREFLFDLKGIKLYKNVELLDSVADMLIISKMPDVEFDEIKGVLQLHKDGVYIKDFFAHNDKMRIKGGCWIDKNGSLDCDINFSFYRDLTDKVPDAVKKALLREEGEGWMGITLKARGNYKRPSLHISGESIKLNIMEGVLLR